MSEDLTDREAVEGLATMWSISGYISPPRNPNDYVATATCAEAIETSKTLRALLDRIEALQAERDDYAAKLMAANDTYTEMHLALETAEAERDAAVMAEREACAIESERRAKIARSKPDWCVTAPVCGAEALRCAAAIRARSNKEPG